MIAGTSIKLLELVAVVHRNVDHLTPHLWISAFCCAVCTEHNWNSQYSVDELELRHLHAHETDCWNSGCMITGYVNRHHRHDPLQDLWHQRSPSNGALYLYTALGWRCGMES